MIYNDDLDDDKTVYGYTDDGAASDPADEDMWLIIENTGERNVIPDRSRKRIGRGKNQDIIVPDDGKRISREHLIISRLGQDIEIEITGLNGAVINDEVYEKGERPSFAPPLKIEMGNIVLSLDTDLTVTHHYYAKDKAPPRREFSHSEGRGGQENDYRRPGYDTPSGHRPRQARESSDPPDWSENSRPYDYRSGEPNSAERQVPPSRPESADSQGNAFDPRPQNIPSDQPEYRENAGSSEHQPHNSGAFQNGTPTHSETPMGNPRSESAFGPVAAEERYRPVAPDRKGNLLIWGVSFLTILLVVALLMIFDNSGRSAPDNRLTERDYAETPRPAPKAPAAPDKYNDSDNSYYKIQIDTAKQYISKEKWDDAVYYLDMIPEESAYFGEAETLKAKISTKRGIQ